MDVAITAIDYAAGTLTMTAPVDRSK
jgi:hypothetical protein